MTIKETCGLWDIDYNSDNCKPEFMTIFVTWQLSVTLDSIRNSCNVLKINFKRNTENNEHQLIHRSVRDKNQDWLFLRPTANLNRLSNVKFSFNVFNFPKAWTMSNFLSMFSIFDNHASCKNFQISNCRNPEQSHINN